MVEVRGGCREGEGEKRRHNDANTVSSLSSCHVVRRCVVRPMFNYRCRQRVVEVRNHWVIVVLLTELGGGEACGEC